MGWPYGKTGFPSLSMRQGFFYPAGFPSPENIWRFAYAVPFLTIYQF